MKNEKEKVEEIENEDKNENYFKSEMKEWGQSILIAVVIALFTKTFLFNTTYVLGNSMHPTLHERDRLFASKISLYVSGPDRGDVVLINAPDVEDKKYVKRVIGVENDTVEIYDGNVYLNGEILEEDYIEEGSYTHVYDQTKWDVGKSEVFVLGDNRRQGASKDSRFFGTVSNKEVIGITKFRYYPFGENFGKID